MTPDTTMDLFRDEQAAPQSGPGSLSCAIEIAATMSAALDRARAAGDKREAIAARMSYHLGQTVSEAMLNAYTAPSRDTHEISLRRAMAFDAAIGSDQLLGLYATKRGRRVITAADAAFIELGRIHQQERDLAERKKALQLLLKTGGLLK